MMEPSARRRSAATKPSWKGVAFIVEAMLLLVFLIGSFAVFTQLFAAAVDRGAQSRVMTDAVAAAGNAAEMFAADPAHMPAELQAGDLRVECAVTDDPRAAGMFRTAVIDVYDGDEVVYTLTTGCYESGGR